MSIPVSNFRWWGLVNGRRTPPFNQMDRGAVSGLLRDSKNQNLETNSWSFCIRI